MPNSRPLVLVPAFPVEESHLPMAMRRNLWTQRQAYIEALRTTGFAPVLVPSVGEDEAYLASLVDHADALLLTGGQDIHPRHYHERPHPALSPSDEREDATDLLLFHLARSRGLPILGICRGAQMINVAMGGSLYQDIRACRPSSGKHDYFPEQGYPPDLLAHGIRISGATLLGSIFEAHPALTVNSLHHQAIARLGRGLRVSARGPDGIVEAVEGTSGPFLVGVQWHPELILDQPAGRAVFSALRGACMRARRGQPLARSA